MSRGAGGAQGAGGVDRNARGPRMRRGPPLQSGFAEAGARGPGPWGRGGGGLAPT